jgi:hypothetical protein
MTSEADDGAWPKGPSKLVIVGYLLWLLGCLLAALNMVVIEEFPASPGVKVAAALFLLTASLCYWPWPRTRLGALRVARGLLASAIGPVQPYNGPTVARWGPRWWPFWRLHLGSMAVV